MSALLPASVRLLPITSAFIGYTRRTFHSLRNTFGSLLTGGGISEEMRMRLAGHSSRDIHQRYTHVETKALQKAIDSIPMRAEIGK